MKPTSVSSPTVRRSKREAARQQALAAAALPALRDSEAHAAAGLQRLNAALTELDAEERRMRERMAELERRVAETEKDIARELTLISDAAATIERLSAEQTELAQAEDAAEAEVAAQARVASTESRPGHDARRALRTCKAGCSISMPGAARWSAAIAKRASAARALPPSARRSSATWPSSATTPCRRSTNCAAEISRADLQRSGHG